MIPAGLIPKGYRIERAERNMDGFMPPEVTFAVVETASAREVARPRAVADRRAGEWIILPGSMASRMDAPEARARAAALFMAAEEVEKRNDERSRNDGD